MMDINRICRLLSIVEKKKLPGIRDNMRIGMLRLLIFPDGSGQVVADWSKYRKEMCREEKLLHEIFSVEGPLFEFDNPIQLEDWLLGEIEEGS